MKLTGSLIYQGNKWLELESKPFSLKSPRTLHPPVPFLYLYNIFTMVRLHLLWSTLSHCELLFICQQMRKLRFRQVVRVFHGIVSNLVAFTRLELRAPDVQLFSLWIVPLYPLLIAMRTCHGCSSTQSC